MRLDRSKPACLCARLGAAFAFLSLLLAAVSSNAAPVKWYLDMETGNPGDYVSPALVIPPATHGGSANWSTVSGSDDPIMYSMTVQAGTDHPLYSPVTIGGIIYDDFGSTRSFLSRNDRDNHYLRYRIPPLESEVPSGQQWGQPKVSLGCYVRLEGFKGYTYASYDLIQLDGGGQFAVLNLDDGMARGGRMYFRIHTRNGVGERIEVYPNATYWVTMLSDSTAGLYGMAELRVYDPADWRLVGRASVLEHAGPHPGRQNVREVRFGRCDEHGGGSISPGTAQYFDDLMVDESGNEWPLMPGGMKFTPSADPKASAYPGACVRQTIVADVNLDGQPDLVSANDPPGEISILLGQANGRFSASSFTKVKGGVVSLAAGDWNSDGILDFAVVAQQENALKILTRKSDGSFSGAFSYTVGLSPESVAVGDFNTDGRPDLAVVSAVSRDVVILLNATRSSGVPVFSMSARLSMGVQSVPRFVGVGDFNGDTKPDLAVADGVSAVVILINNGYGGFYPPVSYAAGAAPSSVATGRFDADDRLDLAVANKDGGTVTILQGMGNGAFKTLAHYAVGAAKTVLAGFFDNNPGVDLIVGGPQGKNLSILIGNGAGGFQPAVPIWTGIGVQTVATGDFNGDGRPDIAVGQSGGSLISVLLNGTLPNP